MGVCAVRVLSFFMRFFHVDFFFISRHVCACILRVRLHVRFASASLRFCFAFLFAVTKLIDSNKLPHLLFYGPPGTGKTSTILACAKKLYGAEFKMMVLEVGDCVLFCRVVLC